MRHSQFPQALQENEQLQSYITDYLATKHTDSEGSINLLF